MFGIGDLFNEGGDEDRSVSSAAYGQGGNDVPVSPRLSCGLSGIYNQGATCYMNSLLQTLLMTPEFRESLFQLGPTHLGSLNCKPGPKARVIPIQLQRLFARLLLLNAQGASTTALTDSFGWTDNQELVQHDVQELNRILFSAIEDSLVGTPGQDLIHNLYHGSLVNQIVCQVCGRVSEREEDFLDLCLAVSESICLQDSLASTYVDTESLEGKNQYCCEACNKLVDAKKGAKIRNLPQILTISLLRFKFDVKKLERIKDTSKFMFPLLLDMSPYVENLTSAGDTDYELFSVVTHSGGAHGGHYTVYIRDIDCLGQWQHPDKEEIQITADPAQGKVDFIECDSPVMLIQTLLSKTPEQGMAVDTLCAELVKQTGVSWNKRFKKHHGPINRFLKRYDEIFELCPQTNWVSLRPATSTTEADVVNGDSANPSDLDPSSSNRKPKKQRPISPPPPDGHCWFCYNDSRVFPARTKDLENQFIGKSSAYMLFYRKKHLRRPPEAYGNKSYVMPLNLITMVDDENCQLEIERSEYEIKIHTITVRLLFPQYFTFENGALQPKDDSFSYLELSIDKRKNIKQLKEEIRNIYDELLQSGDFQLNYAKSLVAGVHIYQCVSGDELKAIADTDITNRGRLMVWDGQFINGKPVPVGADQEPIQLHVTRAGSKFTHGFSKSLTVRELCCRIGELTGVDQNGLGLSRLREEGDEPKTIKVAPEDFVKTLGELKFLDGEQIIVKDSKTATVSSEEVQQISSHLVVAVENRCGVQKDGEWPVVSVPLNKDNSVQELKALVLSKLRSGEQPEGLTRLRMDHESCGLLPPLYETQSLEGAAISNNSRLILEPGEAPTTDQLMITLSNFDSVEVIVDRQTTVDCCLRLLIEKAGQQGEDWHLRKTNWCGEAAEILDDLESTLADYHLKNGEQLLLETGKLPPKGYLKLLVWLYPSPGSADIPWLTRTLQDVLSLSSDKSGAPAQALPACVGEIVISKEAALQDLKLTVLSLPAMEAVSVPMVEFLRLRLVEGGRLSTVLKDQTQTVQRSKVKGSSILGVQVLAEEENLSAHQMVLHVQQRDFTSRSYSAPCELVWDSKEGAHVGGLRQVIADTLSLPAERLVLAKHFPEKYEWLVLRDKPLQVKGPKGKKKGQAKVNLKHAPYHLKDGDVIGVKDLELDPLNKDDFSTLDDSLGREQLRLEIAEKKKRREELKLANAAMGNEVSGRRIEVGIKIHVDKF